MIKIFLKIIILLLILVSSNFSQGSKKINQYINQSDEIITIIFGDTVLQNKQNKYITYSEINRSKNVLMKKCIFDNDNSQIVESYSITNDLATKTYSIFRNDSTHIEFIKDDDTTYITKVFKEPTNSFAFIYILLKYSNIFTTKEISLNLYPLLPQPFEFIAENLGLEEIKIKNVTFKCYHISVDAKGFFEKIIMPDCEIWFDKDSKTMIKLEISDKFLIINDII